MITKIISEQITDINEHLDEIKRAVEAFDGPDEKDKKIIFLLYKLSKIQEGLFSVIRKPGKQKSYALAVTHAAKTIGDVFDTIDDWNLGTEPEFIDEIVARFIKQKDA